MMSDENKFNDENKVEEVQYDFEKSKELSLENNNTEKAKNYISMGCRMSQKAV